VICDKWPIKFQGDTKGISNFFEYFKYPLDMTLVVSGALAIWLTLERMLQNEDRQVLLEDNNRFNNFFKHQEEFIKYFKNETLFELVYSMTGLSYPIQLLPIYKKYYYRSHKNFIPSINSTLSEHIDNYIEIVKNSKINQENFDLNTITRQEIISISKVNDRTIRTLIASLNARMVPEMKNYLLGQSYQKKEVNEILTKFVYLHEIFLSLSFYYSLRAFDGDFSIETENFSTNFKNFEDIVGIGIIKFNASTK
jgi:hypothetical protein